MFCRYAMRRLYMIYTRCLTSGFPGHGHHIATIEALYGAMACSSSTITASTPSTSLFLFLLLTWQKDFVPTAIPHPERSNTAQGSN